MRLLGNVPLLLFCIATLSARPATAATNTVVVSPAPPVQIITCRDGADLDGLIAEFKLAPTFVYRALSGFAAPMDASTIQRLKLDERVLFVEADGPMSLCEQTNSLGLLRLGIEQFPVAPINGISEPLDVDVAVFDTGISHPDVNSFRFYSPFTSNPNDDVGHGSAVAGIIGATDNDFGVVGVAPGVRLWSIKVLDFTHNAWSYLISGMNYAVINADKISVANMSLGNAGFNQVPISSVRGALRKLVAAGVVVVAAAGNDTNDIAGPDGVFQISGNGDDCIPASLAESMAVSAMNPVSDTIWPVSNFSAIPRANNHVISPGGAIDVTAPGVNILVAITNGGYASASGTSMAAPHVSGLVALYIATHGRAYDEGGVYRIRQAIVDAGLPQSQWNTPNTGDQDQKPEPLAFPSTNWLMPAVTQSPSDLRVAEGETALFMAETSGLRPLTYQWILNGTNVTDGDRISGATSNVLSISNAQTGDVGAYQLVITNVYGSTTSAVANLSVGPCHGIGVLSDLAAWWRFEGNTRDAAGTNDGISLRSPVYGPATVGNGLVLNARSGPIMVSNAPALNPTNQLTIEVWYKSTEFGEIGGGGVLVRKRLSKASLIQEQYSLLVNGTTDSTTPTGPPHSFTFTILRGGFGGADEGRISTPTNTWVPGNWYHVVGTYDGTAMKIYVNGDLLASKARSVGPMGDAEQLLWIGGEGLWDGSGTFISSTNSTPGTIDEVSLYKRALTFDEVAQLYRTGSAGKCSVIALIASQPKDLTIPNGGLATFSITASGAEPLSYQWRFNGTNLTGQTQSNLVLTGVTTNQAGLYSVIITNSLGSVTSSVVSLTVLQGIPASAIHYYPFNGMDAIDMIGSAHGVLTNGALVSGGKLRLDGQNDFAYFAEPLLPPNTFSICFYAQQFAPQGGYREMISQHPFYIGQNPSGLMRVGDGWPATGVPFPQDGLVHHYAVTASNGDLKLYLDRELKATQPASLSVPGSIMYFGSQVGSGEFFQGTLDDVWIFTNALSAAEIADLEPLHLPPVLPFITSMTLTNSSVTLTWSTLVGQKYQVQSATTLNSVVWTNFSGIITAESSVLEFSDVLGPTSEKFYRIRLVP